MPHLVLVGDSIFDNIAYVSKGFAVIDHLRNELPDTWELTLLAVDGDVTTDVEKQTKKLPAGTTHIILSAGGNDALRQINLLEQQVRTVSEAFAAFGEVRELFRKNYEAVVKLLLSFSCPVSVCTIYDTVPGIDTTALTALSLFNEVILRVAAANRLPMLDLRLVFAEVSDYSAVSPIEPSATGGAKLAKAIAAMYARHDFDAEHSVIYV